MGFRAELCLWYNEGTGDRLREPKGRCSPMGEFERKQIEMHATEVLAKWDAWTQGVGDVKDIHQIAAEMAATLRFIKSHILAV